MKRFNIRVYGILCYAEQIMLCNETMGGIKMTKFPGGGLQWGEGIADCLKREMKEEIGLELFEAEHFYTTDFFQESIFAPDDQIVSVYYCIRLQEKFQAIPEPGLSVSWYERQILRPEMMTLPIDKVVLKKLLEEF